MVYTLNQLLLFSGFHTGCKCKFKQLISIIEGSWVEEGWDEGSCWIQISSQYLCVHQHGGDSYCWWSQPLIPATGKQGDNCGPVARFTHSPNCQKNTKDTDTYSKLHRKSHPQGDVFTNSECEWWTWTRTGECCLIGMLISHTPRFVSQCACHHHATQPPISLLHPARCLPKYQSDKTTCTPVANAMSQPMYIIYSPCT